jgi:hypothetical protein
MASPLALSGLGSSYLNLFHYGWCRVSSGPGYCHAGIVREGKPECFNSLNFQLCIKRFVDSTTQELCTFSFNKPDCTFKPDCRRPLFIAHPVL